MSTPCAPGAFSIQNSARGVLALRWAPSADFWQRPPRCTPVACCAIRHTPELIWLGAGARTVAPGILGGEDRRTEDKLGVLLATPHDRIHVPGARRCILSTTPATQKFAMAQCGAHTTIPPRCEIPTGMLWGPQVANSHQSCASVSCMPKTRCEPYGADSFWVGET